jgi:hypothetical protein
VAIGCGHNGQLLLELRLLPAVLADYGQTIERLERVC